jgi:hypothetical protein
VYTEEFRKSHHMLLTLYVVIVHKMSDRRSHDEDNWTSKDTMCCWLGWGQWVRLCAAEDNSVMCHHMRSSDWKNLHEFIESDEEVFNSYVSSYFVSKRSDRKYRRFLLIFPWGNKFCIIIFIIVMAFSFY